MAIISPKALVFDAGGTVFDWSTPIAGTLEPVVPELQERESIALDCRGRFLALNGAVIRGERPWMDADRVFAEAMDSSLAGLALANHRDVLERLSTAWRQMPAWDGAADAIRRLRWRQLVAPLTVLSLPMVIGSSRSAGIDWDCVLSCDLLGVYKPDPRCFDRASELLDTDRHDIMMVASHPSDLRAAKAAGWQTAYIRARLFDPDEDYEDKGFKREFDLVLDGFEELASALA